MKKYCPFYRVYVIIASEILSSCQYHFSLFYGIINFEKPETPVNRAVPAFLVTNVLQVQS